MGNISFVNCSVYIQEYLQSKDKECGNNSNIQLSGQMHPNTIDKWIIVEFIYGLTFSYASMYVNVRSAVFDGEGCI